MLAFSLLRQRQNYRCGGHAQLRKAATLN